MFDASAVTNDGSVDSTVESNSNTSGINLADQDRFGSSVANIGDLDGDGVNDLLVGNIGNDNGGPNRGAAHILFMNTDGTVKSAIKIKDATANGPILDDGDNFGFSAESISDLNGDGVNDFIIGAPKDDGNGGTSPNSGNVAILYPDTDGSFVKAKREIKNTTANGPTISDGDLFGISVANMDDLNGDGFDDLAIGASKDDAGGTNRGAVHIIYMANNGFVSSSEEINSNTANGPTLSDEDYFGRSVENIGDLDGDGVNDLAVGAHLDDEGDTNQGAVHILFMNTDGSVKSTVEINDSTANGPTLSDRDQFGEGIENMGDLNGDGINDLAVVAPQDDAGGTERGALHILFMTAIPEEVEEVEKQRSGACGFDRDCTAPRITNHGESETPDGFSINDNVFEENQERYNENPTIQGTVGEPVTIKVRAWENMGTDKITLAIAYLAMHDEKPDWRDSTANIEFSIQQDEFKVYDKNKIFSAVGAVTEKVEDPYGDNGALELLDITFTIIFAKPMESSHIGIQTIDHITNYDLVYFENALEILPKEIVEVEEIPEEILEKVPESLPEVVPEVVPEPEPPVKEPEPEVMLTAIDEKTVLEFVDENMPAKHYVKRYITETEYKEWFDVNYSDYKFWEGIGITQERFDQIVLEIESEPEPKMVQTGFVFVPEDEKSLPLVEETYEPEPPEVEPVKEEKKGFFDWLFDLFN